MHRVLWLLATVALTACRKPTPDASPLDCGEDLGCAIARASQCLPATVLHRERAAMGARIATPTVIRYEVVGRVRGRCHVRRTQVEPAWTMPEIGPRPAEDPYGDWARLRDNPYSNALGSVAPVMQCLYSDARAAEALSHLREGGFTLADWEPCYPGPGTCGRMPLVSLHCAVKECLLGRWIFVCTEGGGRNPRVCEGTRLSDNSEPGRDCSSGCDESGKEWLDCVHDWGDRLRIEQEREQERKARWNAAP